jgi:hypothetical protein
MTDEKKNNDTIGAGETHSVARLKSSYDLFLEELRKLRFCEVSFFVAKREDLISFVAKDGAPTTVKDPWFSNARGEFTNEEWRHALVEYTYYYGKAANDTVYFCKKSRTDRRFWFLPTRLPIEHRYLLPQPGQFIFGPVSSGPIGPVFEWWERIEKADALLAGLLLGTMTFSQGKIEKKLTINRDGYTDRTPFLFAKALHFRDVDFFVNLMKSGESSRGFGRGRPIYFWLKENIADILPEFWEEFRANAGFG